jgi:hypothetical protein
VYAWIRRISKHELIPIVGGCQTIYEAGAETAARHDGLNAGQYIDLEGVNS